MPGLRGRRWSVVRLDGDTYESTWLALESLYPGLSPGGYLIVDDYHFVGECKRAVDDFRREHEISEPLESVDWSCMRWRRESAAPPAEPGEARPVADRPAVERAAPERTTAPIPSLGEIELERELDALRERLRAAESELERMRGRTEA